eukprot:8496398-Pyramimonas_sp.AAC.1
MTIGTTMSYLPGGRARGGGGAGPLAGGAVAAAAALAALAAVLRAAALRVRRGVAVRHVRRHVRPDVVRLVEQLSFRARGALRERARNRHRRTPGGGQEGARR